MYGAKDPVRTRFDMVRTIASVITAACLLTITITMFVAGTWTVSTVHNLQSTYHPERLASILSDASDTMTTIHKTTNMLKSSRGNELTIMDDLHQLMTSVNELSKSLDNLHVERVLEESTSWRNNAEHIVGALKKTLINE